MGYMRHHAFVITGFHGDFLQRAHQEAVQLGMAVSEIVKSNINGYKSFFVAPDGSKEGWLDSDEGDIQRTALIKFLQGFRDPDGDSPLSWALIMYGDTNRRKYIITNDDLIPPGSEIMS